MIYSEFLLLHGEADIDGLFIRLQFNDAISDAEIELFFNDISYSIELKEKDQEIVFFHILIQKYQPFHIVAKYNIENTSKLIDINNTIKYSIEKDARFLVNTPLKCYFPFHNISITSDGAFYPCICGSWLKNSFEFGNQRTIGLESAWNSAKMTSMRKSFIEGKYSDYCHENSCPYLNDIQTDFNSEWNLTYEAALLINSGSLTFPLNTITTMSHGVDRGCDLSCPMCRVKKYTPDKENIKIAISEIKNVVQTSSLKRLRISGEGEVLIFKEFINFLSSNFLLENDIEIEIVTNATNFNEKLWKKICHNKIERLTISADGATKETYEKIRRGGNWDVVLSNMNFAGQLRKERKIKRLFWNWVVMPANISEMMLAKNISDEIGFDFIWFINQMGTGMGEFSSVFDSSPDVLESFRKITSDLGKIDKIYSLDSNRTNGLDYYLKNINSDIFIGWNYQAALKSIKNLISGIRNNKIILTKTISEDALDALSICLRLDLIDCEYLKAIANDTEKKLIIDFLTHQANKRIDWIEEKYSKEFILPCFDAFTKTPSEIINEINSAEFIIIWGAGNTGTRVKNLVFSATGRSINGFIDINKTGTWEDTPIYSPMEIPKYLRKKYTVLVGSAYGFGIYFNAIKLGYKKIINGLCMSR